MKHNKSMLETTHHSESYSEVPVHPARGDPWGVTPSACGWIDPRRQYFPAVEGSSNPPKCGVRGFYPAILEDVLSLAIRTLFLLPPDWSRKKKQRLTSASHSPPRLTLRAAIGASQVICRCSKFTRKFLLYQREYEKELASSLQHILMTQRNLASREDTVLSEWSFMTRLTEPHWIS